MNLSNRLLIALVFAGINSVYAQSSNVQSASDALRYYDGDKTKTHELAKAKDYIDKAAENETTSNDPKMWYYRGKVYFSIYENRELSASNPDAAYKATEGFINCLKTDKRKYYLDDTEKMVWVSAVALFNKGVEMYNKNETGQAIRFYSKIAEVFQYDKDNNLKRNNVTADILNKNIFLSYYKQKNYDEALGYLQKLVDVNYNDPMIYLYMSRIYLEKKDTLKALEAIDKGRKLFDDNLALINQETGIYLAQGKIDVLIGKLTDAISDNPENELLYFNRATLYEHKKQTDNSVADYKKALELKPDYFDVNYSLGVLYFNQAADLANKANEAKSNDEFARLKEKFEKKFGESQPLLEQAMDLNPRKTEVDEEYYKVTLNCLKQLYARTNQMEKYNKIKSLTE